MPLAAPAPGWSALRTIKPEKAVIAAAKAGPEGVGGVFKMVVVAVGHQRGASGLIGRKIYVRGQARTVRIDFTVDAQPSGKYYYQTHVLVSDPVQIAVKDRL